MYPNYLVSNATDTARAHDNDNMANVLICEVIAYSK